MSLASASMSGLFPSLINTLRSPDASPPPLDLESPSSSWRSIEYGFIPRLEPPKLAPCISIGMNSRGLCDPSWISNLSISLTVSSPNALSSCSSAFGDPDSFASLASCSTSSRVSESM